MYANTPRLEQPSRTSPGDCMLFVGSKGFIVPAQRLKTRAVSFWVRRVGFEEGEFRTCSFVRHLRTLQDVLSRMQGIAR